ncbi:MAG: DUF63 family protein [Candidatus Aenigmarchaeota archaeon]|nr:DUF63 family protein [Candidatus Aenigmarchaeota archaeon]
MADLIQEYFINPILQNGWYNPLNTIVYSILLVIGVYLVYRMLKRMDVHIDSRFFLAILPFILWGSTTRVLHDAAYAGILSPELNAFYGSPIFPTPGSYIITFALALFVLLISLLAQRFTRFPYWKAMFGIGIVLDIVNFLILPVFSFFPIILILGITILWAAVFYLPRNVFTWKIPSFNKLFSIDNTGILSAHFLDATATVTALTLFGYLEQHVVPRLFFPIMGPFAMFFLKVVVVLPVLWIVDRYAEEGDFKNFLKIVILILGLAPGLRDMIRLGVGV